MRQPAKQRLRQRAQCQACALLEEQARHLQAAVRCGRRLMRLRRPRLRRQRRRAAAAVAAGPEDTGAAVVAPASLALPARSGGELGGASEHEDQPAGVVPWLDPDDFLGLVFRAGFRGDDHEWMDALEGMSQERALQGPHGLSGVLFVRLLTDDLARRCRSAGASLEEMLQLSQCVTPLQREAQTREEAVPSPQGPAESTTAASAPAPAPVLPAKGSMLEEARSEVRRQERPAREEPEAEQPQGREEGEEVDRSCCKGGGLDARAERPPKEPQGREAADEEDRSCCKAGGLDARAERPQKAPAEPDGHGERHRGAHAGAAKAPPLKSGSTAAERKLVEPEAVTPSTGCRRAARTGRSAARPAGGKRRQQTQFDPVPVARGDAAGAADWGDLLQDIF
mmetsp:Transcript_3756/g.11475  ORF Transcript_3756/g.11475 Transcript_3756/m.11475 type:complete len:396 (-) Transcript_3756:130-1317(-)